MLVYLAQVGAEVTAGQPIFDVVNPVDGIRTTTVSHTNGVFYMRREVRYVKPGDQIGRVSGARAFRAGNLLSP
ncbi:hypothetical protein AB4156_35870 [Cupriavidus sp. 2MCAB6]|uniref:hypothetical protein n=1 Tax=Cupriavidus sp. 2MCAB6 TaxID=3232981 RepID=UPI003F92EFF3